MNQVTYDLIMKILINGAPALADELCGEFARIVTERNEFEKELIELKKSKTKDEE